MQKNELSDFKTRVLYKDESKPLSKQEMAVVTAFIKDSLIKAPDGRIAKVGENIVVIAHDCPIPRRSTFMAGVLMGEIKGSTFFPSHNFFSAYGEIFKHKEQLTRNDERVEKYLAGEEIS